jgi:hypothetical protein
MLGLCGAKKVVSPAPPHPIPAVDPVHDDVLRAPLGPSVRGRYHCARALSFWNIIRASGCRQFLKDRIVFSSPWLFRKAWSMYAASCGGARTNRDSGSVGESPLIRRSLLEEERVAKFMALAKELARGGPRRGGSPNGQLPLSHKDPTVHRNQQVGLPETPAITSSKTKRNWELIIGCYILVLLGVLVFSVRIFSDRAPVTGPVESIIVSQPKLVDSPDQSNSPNNLGASEAAKATIRFAEFGCASPVCTVSCDTSERIVNAFMLGADAAFTYENERGVTVRPLRLPSSKIVLVCVPQQ